MLLRRYGRTEGRIGWFLCDLEDTGMKVLGGLSCIEFRWYRGWNLGKVVRGVSRVFSDVLGMERWRNVWLVWEYDLFGWGVVLDE